ncbi:general secretion pathway protein GspB [Massilia eburnea]|uniref:general secretion pathway protein GspB n=1 Tax=Massilia eburnea TaxID=1776165 RepID=UPI003D6A0A89
MSYILEALKKAQAERQIGSTPTIHAPTLASVPAGQGARSKRTPVIVAMALMAAAIAGLATLLVRQQPAANQPPAAVAATAATQAAARPASAPVAAVAAPAVADSATPAAATAASAAAAPAAAGPAAAGQAPAQQAVLQSPAAMTTPPVQRSVSPQTAGQRGSEAPQLAATKPGGTATRAADVAQAAPAAPPAPAPAPAPAEEQVQSLRELPEPIQRAIPQITLGGYMYSKNPADRLLLIDKVLRREGEEVAPGLILDKLQPKQAVFSFRGYRYRVPL